MSYLPSIETQRVSLEEILKTAPQAIATFLNQYVGGPLGQIERMGQPLQSLAIWEIFKTAPQAITAFLNQYVGEPLGWLEKMGRPSQSPAEPFNRGPLCFYDRPQPDGPPPEQAATTPETTLAQLGETVINEARKELDDYEKLLANDPAFEQAKQSIAAARQYLDLMSGVCACDFHKMAKLQRQAADLFQNAVSQLPEEQRPSVEDLASWLDTLTPEEQDNFYNLLDSVLTREEKSQIEEIEHAIEPLEKFLSEEGIDLWIAASGDDGVYQILERAEDKLFPTWKKTVERSGFIMPKQVGIGRIDGIAPVDPTNRARDEASGAHPPLITTLTLSKDREDPAQLARESVQNSLRELNNYGLGLGSSADHKPDEQIIKLAHTILECLNQICSYSPKDLANALGRIERGDCPDTELEMLKRYVKPFTSLKEADFAMLRQRNPQIYALVQTAYNQVCNWLSGNGGPILPRLHEISTDIPPWLRKETNDHRQPERTPTSPPSPSPPPPPPPSPSPSPSAIETGGNYGRWWWILGVGFGIVGGIGTQMIGQGEWVNPLARGILSAVSAGIGFSVSGMEILANLSHDRTRFEEWERKYGKAAHYAHRFVGGLALGIGSVSLTSLAFQILEHGIPAVTSSLPNISPETFTKRLNDIKDWAIKRAQEFTEQTPTLPIESIIGSGETAVEGTEKVARAVQIEGTVSATATSNLQSSFEAKLSNLEIPKGGNVWRAVHDITVSEVVNNWKTPGGSDLADKVAQFVADFIRYNGHNPDLVYPGTLNLSDCLLPDQIDFLHNLAKTTNEAEYQQLLREFVKKNPGIEKKIPAIAKALARGKLMGF